MSANEFLLRWTFKDTDGHQKNISQDSHYIQTKSTLVIRNVETSDAGIYTCQISSELGKEQMTIKLHVVGKRL